MIRCLRCGATGEWIEGRVPVRARDDEVRELRALLVDIDKSGLLTHAWKCHKVIDMLPCDCECDALQDRINAATAAKEEP